MRSTLGLPSQALLGDFIPKPLLRFALNKGFINSLRLACKAHKTSISIARKAAGGNEKTACEASQAAYWIIAYWQSPF